MSLFIASKIYQATPLPSSRVKKSNVQRSKRTLPQKCVCRWCSRAVAEIARSQGFIPRELVVNEVQWFYAHLGIDDTYFRNESVEVISDHIIALFGAKVLAYTKHDPSKLVIDLEKIDPDGNGATFIHTSAPGKTSSEGPGSHVEPR